MQKSLLSVPRIHFLEHVSSVARTQKRLPGCSGPNSVRNMRIQVFEKQQNPLADSPAHHISKRLAGFIVDGGLGLMLAKNALHLTTEETFSSTKDRFRRVTLSLRYLDDKDGGILLPPLDHYLPYGYPLPDQRSASFR